jgi:F-box/leucine-rich repeat protein 2/20
MTVSLNTTDMFLIADCFPNLKLLELNNCYNLSEEGIAHVLRKCSNIRHLNLENCIGLKLSEINFEVPELRVLNLSYTRVDDESLYVISKSCRGLLKLVLNNCCDVTEKGVKHVAKNCTKLREISLRGCYRVDADVVGSIVSSRPSLRKITAPPLL